MTNLNPADLGPDPIDPLSALAREVKAAKADAEAYTDHPVTIADVAAAAFVALETLVALMPTEEGRKIVAEFEQRAATFAASMEANDGTVV